MSVDFGNSHILFGGAGAYAQNKILLQDFALKMQGRLMHNGVGVHICGTLQYMYHTTCEVWTQDKDHHVAQASELNPSVSKILKAVFCNY